MKYLIFALTSLILTSCASIFNDAHEKIKLDSKPRGAIVYIDGNKIGTTPTQFSLKRRHKRYEIFLKKIGYKDVKLQTKRTVNLLAFLNVFTYGIGLFADDASGAMYRHLPGNILINLPRSNENTHKTQYPEPTPFIRSFYINAFGRNALNLMPISLDFDFHISDKILLNAGIGGMAPLVNAHLYFTYLFSGYESSFEVSIGFAYHEHFSLNFGGGSSEYIESGYGIGTEIGYRYQPKYGGILFRAGISITYLAGMDEYKDILNDSFYWFYKKNFLLLPYISLGLAF